MSQRTLAGIVALPLMVGLWLAAVFMPLPYVTYAPGITVDLLGAEQGEEIVQADEETFHDDGQLLLTTVYVTRPDTRVNVFEVMAAWFDRDKAVLPYEAVYSSDETPEDVQLEGAVQIASSRDNAVAVALARMGRPVKPSVQVLSVGAGLPAEGVLETGDLLVEVQGKPVATPQDVVDAVDTTPDGQAVKFRIRRDGKETDVEVMPREVDGDRRVGITPGVGYDFPFDVQINVSPKIGGPSAGLLFALSVYDTLTPGSLTGGETVAGTGSLAPDGAVGPIGGIAQKIASSREVGAELFMVPAANCEEALGARNGDMRLVRVDNFNDAVTSIETWVDDPDAALPSCERNKEQ